MTKEHCNAFRAFDDAYMKVIRDLTRSDIDGIRANYAEWIDARDRCKAIIVTAATEGRFELLHAVDEAVGHAFQSLDSSWDELFRSYPLYVASRKKVFPMLCPKGVISKIAAAIKISPGVFGVGVDSKELFGMESK